METAPFGAVKRLFGFIDANTSFAAMETAPFGAVKPPPRCVARKDPQRSRNGDRSFRSGEEGRNGNVRNHVNPRAAMETAPFGAVKRRERRRRCPRGPAAMETAPFGAVKGWSISPALTSEDERLCERSILKQESKVSDYVVKEPICGTGNGIRDLPGNTGVTAALEN